MTIKEQFAEFMEISRRPSKDIKKLEFIAKAITLVAALEDESNPVDNTVFDCLTDEDTRHVLGGVIGLLGSIAAQD